MRFASLDYLYVCAYFTNLSREVFYRKSGAETTVWFILWMSLVVTVNFTSYYIFDINALLRATAETHAVWFQNPGRQHVAMTGVTGTMSAVYVCVHYSATSSKRLVKKVGSAGDTLSKWLTRIAFVASGLVAAMSLDYPILAFVVLVAFYLGITLSSVRMTRSLAMVSSPGEKQGPAE